MIALLYQSTNNGFKSTKETIYRGWFYVFIFYIKVKLSLGTVIIFNVTVTRWFQLSHGFKTTVIKYLQITSQNLFSTVFQWIFKINRLFAMFYFYTPWKYKKSYGSLMFIGSTEI